MAVYASQLIDIQRIQGRWDELTEMGELMAAVASENPGLPILRVALAWAYCDLNRDEEARLVIDDDFADGFDRFPYDLTWLQSMVGLSEICVHLRLLRRRSTPLCQFESLARPGVDIHGPDAGPVALYLGTLAMHLGRYDAAAGHFAEALDVSERLESPYWIARTQIAWAQLDRKIGSTGQGRVEARRRS